MEGNYSKHEPKLEWQLLKEKMEIEAKREFADTNDVRGSEDHITPRKIPPSSSDPEIDQCFHATHSQIFHYAGFWLRFLAFVIDSLIFAIAGIILGFFVGQTGGSTKSLDMPFFIISWLYYALMESSPKRATLGKIVLGISVTDLSGHRISFGRATGRYFGKIISGIILSLGYIMAAFTTKKQALHDIMASTLVIKN